MNKSEQKEKGLYLEYWTKSGIEGKNYNFNCKIKIVTKYYDKNGNEKEKVHYRHPTLDDLIFIKKSVKHTELSKEEKAKRMEELPYSKKHNDLVNSLYSKENRIAKQQYATQIHEAQIAKMMEEKKEYQIRKSLSNKQNKPNLLVVKRPDSKGVYYDFSVTPSSKTLSALKKDANDIETAFAGDTKEKPVVEVWEKSAYMKKYTDSTIEPYYKTAA